MRGAELDGVIERGPALDAPLHVGGHDDTVEDRNAGQGDEAYGGRDAEREAAPHEAEDPPDQRERNDGEHRACVACALEHPEEHAEDDREAHWHHDGEPLLRALEVLELSAPRHFVAARKLHLRADLRARLVHP